MEQNSTNNRHDDIIKRIRAITEQVKALTDRLNRENEEMKKCIEELDKEVFYGCKESKTDL